MYPSSLCISLLFFTKLPYFKNGNGSKRVKLNRIRGLRQKGAKSIMLALNVKRVVDEYKIDHINYRLSQLLF